VTQTSGRDGFQTRLGATNLTAIMVLREACLVVDPPTANVSGPICTPALSFDWHFRVLGLHSSDQRGCRRPLQPCDCRHDRDCTAGSEYSSVAIAAEALKACRLGGSFLSTYGSEV
jgi:hypothetical protein